MSCPPFRPWPAAPTACSISSGERAEAGRKNSTELWSITETEAIPRVFREVSALGERLERISDAVAPTCNRARAAILFDWENWWAVEDIQGPRKNMAYVDTVLSHFRPFWELGIEVDFINEEDSMEGYDLVCAPLAYQYREGYAQRVKKICGGGRRLSCHVFFRRGG